MVLPGIVAVTVMLSAGVVISADSAPVKSMLYAYYQWLRRRRRDHRSHPRGTP